jgi:hypothetical protein
MGWASGALEHAGIAKPAMPKPLSKVPTMLMNPLTLLKPNPPLAPRTRRRRVQTDDTTASPCGWFESSHDLSSGLLVQEISSAQTEALDTWLQCQLRLATTCNRHHAHLN